MELWPYLTAGSCVEIVKDETGHSPTALKQWLVESGTTNSFLPTPMAELICEERWNGGGRLKRVLTEETG